MHEIRLIAHQSLTTSGARAEKPFLLAVNRH